MHVSEVRELKTQIEKMAKRGQVTFVDVDLRKYIFLTPVMTPVHPYGFLSMCMLQVHAQLV